MKFQSKFIVSALCSSLCLVGCGGGDTLDRATKVRDVVASTVVVPSDSPAHDMPDAAKATTTSANIESVEDIRAAAAAVQTARPGFYDTVMSMEPRRTRNDMLRFIGGEMHDPDAAPIFALRLLDGVNTPELERRAMNGGVVFAGHRLHQVPAVALPEVPPLIGGSVSQALRGALQGLDQLELGVGHESSLRRVPDRVNPRACRRPAGRARRSNRRPVAASPYPTPGRSGWPRCRKTSRRTSRC